jgi:hypothetical protein
MSAPRQAAAQGRAWMESGTSAGGVSGRPAANGFYVKPETVTARNGFFALSYTNLYAYVNRLLSMMESPTVLPDPLWLTALASLIKSLATPVWALRQKR